MTERLEEGYRADLAAVADIHDLDAHQVAIDFPHEVLDGYRTDWAKGCWDESFAKQLPVMVWNHNPDLLIGGGVRTETLGDRSRVVERFADFDAVPQARAAHSMISDQIVPGFSFHYRNGRTVAHPNVRGARRFVKADMLEVSPVTFPSIPGAKAVGIRSEEATLEVPTINEILALQDRGLLDEDGVRAMIAEHHPNVREHIKIVGPSPTERVVELLGDDHGLRDMVLRIGSDGTVSTDGGGSNGGDGDDGYGDDVAVLAAAVDASLDEACRLIGTVDITTLPDEVQQAIALTQAAEVAAGELLETMGVNDPDADDPEARAMLSSKEANDLPDSAFAYIEEGGTKDSEGKTVPRSKRHFPIQDAAHVRNALARIGQGAQFGKEALSAVKEAAKKFGIDTDNTSGGRSADDIEDPDLEDDLVGMFDRLGIAQ